MNRRLSVIWLFALWSEAAKAQDWLQMEGNSIIDIEAYKEIDLSRPPLVQRLPNEVDLSIYFPVPSNQGQQGSCSAWASTYALMTYLQYGESTISLSNQDYLFSPSYTFNYSSGENCTTGMAMAEALQHLKEEGAVPLSVLPYDSQRCDISSTVSQEKLKDIAAEHRISDYGRAEMQPEIFRAFLAKGHPVLVAIQTDDAFHDYRGGANFDVLWNAGFAKDDSEKDKSHAMVLVGYNISNDTFRVLNSWGTEWGEQGYASMTTEALLSRILRAYIIQPFPKKAQSIVLPSLRAKPINKRSLHNKTVEVDIQVQAKRKVSFHSECTDIWVSDAPVLQLSYQSTGSHALHFNTTDSGVTHLLAQAPNGDWRCDFGAHQEHPWVVFPAAVDGEYKIWVGSQARNDSLKTTLSVANNPPTPIQHLDQSRTRVLSFTKDFDNGWRYEGEWLNYKFHGYGVFSSPTGEVYRGEWKNDQKHGAGQYIWSNGSHYDGNWQEDQFHGVGLYVWKTGASYDGDWVNGIRQGTGRYISSKGDLYEGKWQNDQKNGMGKQTWASGTMYNGMWVNGTREGSGKQVWTNGSSYDGDWKQGNRHGIGTYLWSDGSGYAGQWNNDQKEGRGVYTWSDGSYYEGEFLDGKFHGNGIKVSSNGSRYEGEWQKDKKHGTGKQIWANGDFYDGDWKNGKRTGWGIYVWSNGSRYEGRWKNGERID